MKQAEMADEARIVEADREAEVDTRSRRDARLALRDPEPAVAAGTGLDEPGAKPPARSPGLKVQLSDAVAEKQVADEKLSTLMKENESDKHEALDGQRQHFAAFPGAGVRADAARYPPAGMRGFAGRDRDRSTPASRSCCRMSGSTGSRRPGCARPGPASTSQPPPSRKRAVRRHATG